MKGLILLANGFEDVEALAPRDILIRGGVDVITASIDQNIEVQSSHKIYVKANLLLKDVNKEDYDFLILPGGGLGTQNLLNSKSVSDIVTHFINNHKLVCAICAAPMVLGKLGYLKGHRYTCFKGCNEGIDGIFTMNEVESDDNIITARSMLYSVPFGLTILEQLLGKAIRNKVEIAIKGK